MNKPKSIECFLDEFRFRAASDIEREISNEQLCSRSVIDETFENIVDGLYFQLEEEFDRYG